MVCCSPDKADSRVCSYCGRLYEYMWLAHSLSHRSILLKLWAWLCLDPSHLNLQAATSTPRPSFDLKLSFSTISVSTPCDTHTSHIHHLPTSDLSFNVFCNRLRSQYGSAAAHVSSAAICGGARLRRQPDLPRQWCIIGGVVEAHQVWWFWHLQRLFWHPVSTQFRQDHGGRNLPGTFACLYLALGRYHLC